MKLPIITIKPRSEIRIVLGGVWIFSNEIENFSEIKNLENGSLVEIWIYKNKAKEFFAIGYFNPKTLIAARILSHKKDQEIDQNFFTKKISNAMKIREKFFSQPYYRLIHSEGDFLPGLVIDRFNDVFVCQISTAGMQKFEDLIIQSLKEIFADCRIILKNDIESRKLEMLELEVKEIDCSINEKIVIEENNAKFLIDVKNGQKTGWFFDQRKNREFIASISNDCEILDAFCYQGGFGLAALKNNAKSVYFIDSSQDAIDQVKENYQLNNFEKNCQFICDKVFETLEKLNNEKKQFDIVLLDPPAFIKNKKDLFSGLKGYEKLIKLSSTLVKKGGILMLSSCSYHATISDLTASANNGFRKNNIRASLIRTFAAGVDHPVHPSQKENEYLKSLTFLVNYD